MADGGKASLKTFFSGVKAEFKKIIWPDKDTLIKQTVVVVVVSVVLGCIIAVVDSIMQGAVNLLTM